MVILVSVRIAAKVDGVLVFQASWQFAKYLTEPLVIASASLYTLQCRVNPGSSLLDHVVRPEARSFSRCLVMASADELIASCRVTENGNVRLKDYEPDWAGDPKVPKEQRKQYAEKSLTEDISELAEAQDRLYAADSWSILMIFQAMDAAGKDSTIKHVMSGVNPQGCQVFSFKQPSREELDHNFLWRYTRALPNEGGSASSIDRITRKSGGPGPSRTDQGPADSHHQVR